MLSKNSMSLILVPTFLFLGACASYRPILDENPKLQQVGETQAEQDIDTCLAKADSYLARHKEDRMMKQMGRTAAVGAVVGGVVGGVLGAASGKNLGTAVGGAAIGGGVGAAVVYAGEKAKDNFTPDQLKQRYVKNCLSRKKYQVIGWK